MLERCWNANEFTYPETVLGAVASLVEPAPDSLPGLVGAHVEPLAHGDDGQVEELLRDAVELHPPVLHGLALAVPDKGKD